MNNNLPKRFYKKPQPTTQAISLKPQKTEFPSISRSIPENVINAILSPVFLTAIICGFFVAAILIVGNDLRHNISRLDEIKHERNVLAAQVVQWSGLVSQFEDYRDGYFQLALLESRLGNYDKALLHLTKVLQIDPTFIKARQLFADLAEK